MGLIGGASTHFYAKSLEYTNQTLLSLEQAHSMFQWLEQSPKGTLAWFIIWDLSGGAVSDPSQDATAYWHRDAVFFQQSYVIDLLALEKVNDVARHSLNGFNEKVMSLREAFDESAYAGYVDDNLTKPDVAYILGW